MHSNMIQRTISTLAAPSDISWSTFDRLFDFKTIQTNLSDSIDKSQVKTKGPQSKLRRLAFIFWKRVNYSFHKIRREALLTTEGSLRTSNMSLKCRDINNQAKVVKLLVNLKSIFSIRNQVSLIRAFSLINYYGKNRHAFQVSSRRKAGLTILKYQFQNRMKEVWQRIVLIHKTARRPKKGSVKMSMPQQIFYSHKKSDSLVTLGLGKQQVKDQNIDVRDLKCRIQRLEGIVLKQKISPRCSRFGQQITIQSNEKPQTFRPSPKVCSVKAVRFDSTVGSSTQKKYSFYTNLLREHQKFFNQVLDPYIQRKRAERSVDKRTGQQQIHPTRKIL